jgi:hypothetical protein
MMSWNPLTEISHLEIARSRYAVLVENIVGLFVHLIVLIRTSRSPFRVWVPAFRPGRDHFTQCERYKRGFKRSHVWLDSLLRSVGRHNETRAKRHMVRADIIAR